MLLRSFDCAQEVGLVRNNERKHCALNPQHSMAAPHDPAGERKNQQSAQYYQQPCDSIPLAVERSSIESVTFTLINAHAFTGIEMISKHPTTKNTTAQNSTSDCDTGSVFDIG